MLHVDAMGDTYIDATDALHIADDVVFTEEGRIGVGTVTPQARLDIRGSIRIADGTEGHGKILTSDASGAARWERVLGSWYAALRGGSTTSRSAPFTFTASESSPPGAGSASHASGTVTVPYTGLYTITITCMYDAANLPAYTLAWFAVYANNSNIGGFGKAVHPSLSESVYLSNMGFASLNENDVVRVEVVNQSISANVYTDVTLRLDFVK
jgi:hypothetical protein